MALNNKTLIVILLLIIGSDAFTQIDTLDVYLEKSQEYKYGVNLVFQNNSNDTIFLSTRFRNLSLGGEIPPVYGICINFYYDGRSFTFNWGELPPLYFSFPEKYILIYPKSKAKLLFNIGEYFRFPEQSNKKYEVSFLITYLYTKYHSQEVPKTIRYYTTNRITMVEPTEDKIGE